VVTETDQAVEKFIMDEISTQYPDFSFIGEESFAGGETVELTDKPTFIVDPIGE
jgi:myo-inositol-1(or 4)-monophosphatase